MCSKVSQACVVTMLAICDLAVWGQSPQNFVTVTPCRIVDTRIGQGGTIITGGNFKPFTIAGSCGIPANASAYSLNVTAVPQGPLSFLTIWPAGQSQPLVSTLNATFGQVTANAAMVPAGTNGAVNVFATNPTDIIVDVNGYFLNQSQSNNTAVGTGALVFNAGTSNTAAGFDALFANTSGSQNTAVGTGALLANNVGGQNTALGVNALTANTSGTSNVGVGYTAAAANTTGVSNIGVGAGALGFNQTGSNNVAVGAGAISATSGTSLNENVAIGAFSLSAITGNSNVAVGSNALRYNSGGSNNIALGDSAGILTTSGQFNIEIGNQGAPSDSNVIRIGTQGSQNVAYIAGIANSNVTGSAVLVDPVTGQLGIAPSSARYKKDVYDMGEASDPLMQLRPVTFRYKRLVSDGSNQLEYGLIAEEVAAVFPELVVYGKGGEVESVQYHQLPALLLNEVQKQHRLIEELRDKADEIESLKARIAALEKFLPVKGDSPVH